jgi:hypothetical protein
MADAPTWYAKLFQVTTGSILGDLPLAQTPGALIEINQQGSWTCSTTIGGGGLARDTLRSLTKGFRYGVAICYGTGSAQDYIFQAGPILAAQLLQESPPVFQLGGSDPWALLNATYLIDPASQSIVTFTASMQGIAAAIINAAIARNPLPIDTAVGAAGSVTRTYNWYDFTFAGQALQALTQASGGPDVYFQPYFATASTLRWRPVLGNPYITQSGAPLLFDQGSNLVETRPSVDSHLVAGTWYARGNGVEAGTLYASATDPTLQANGWPLLEATDSSQTSLTDLTALAAVANGDVALYNRPVETWTAWVRTAGRHPLGTYPPGLFATYNISDSHPLIPPGRWSQRILGLTRNEGDDPRTIQHILHALQGAI